MQVDRQKFLLLVTSLASGCSVGPELTGPVTIAAPAELEPAAGDEPLVEDDAVAANIDRSGGAVDSEVQAMRRRCRELESPPGPTCESFEDTKLECEGFPDVLEEKAAKAAVRCMVARSGSRGICRYDVVEQCFMAGIRTARPSSVSRKECREVLQRCSGRPRSDLSMSTCQRAVSAVREERRSELA
jgi:hypothetical protein